jgi:HD-GYP domain-containing protein (c-di-GMP phosphodiesterase class II)
MVSERPYQQALEPGEAIEALNKLAGSQFDPAIVTAFIAIAETGVCPIEGHAVREALERVGQASDFAAGSAFKGEH